MNGIDKTSAGSAGADDGAVCLDEPLLDCAAAAALLNVRVSWVRDAVRLGHLPCLRVGRHLRFSRVMLEAWLAGQFSGSAARGRPYPRAANGGQGRSSRVALRRATEAALLANVAETPTSKEAGGHE
ncbi:MAG: helix-turn-helix domain-containing protein [Solirubrobacteraceae bacterium]